MNLDLVSIGPPIYIIQTANDVIAAYIHLGNRAKNGAAAILHSLPVSYCQCSQQFATVEMKYSQLPFVPTEFSRYYMSSTEQGVRKNIIPYIADNNPVRTKYKTDCCS